MSSKLDKIEYFNAETGEEISQVVYESIQKEEKRKRYKELHFKFDSDNITFNELVELMKMINKTKNIKILYQEFYIVNISKNKPEGISHNEYGKFFDMLNLMSVKNRIEYQSNGKAISKDKIAKKLKFKNIRSFYNFISKLAKHKMLAEIKVGGIKYIAINPAYAQRSIKLNSTIYNLFKEDLQEYLDPYQIKYLELYEEDFEIDSVIAFD